MKAKFFGRVIAITLSLCLLLSALSGSIVVSSAADSAIEIENMGDYACADFSNNRLFTLKGTKLYLTDLNYGGGYMLFDYAQIAPDSTLTLLDANVVGTKLYTLFSDSVICYLNIIDITQLQSYTNTLNFSCEKLIALENGDVMVTLQNGGSAFLFYLQSNGTYDFYPLTDHIDCFYGYLGNTIYYRTSAGLSYATFSRSGFVQSGKTISGVSAPAINRVGPMEFFGSNISASNKGEVYSVSNATLFTKELTFDRSGYTQSSGSLTTLIQGAGILIGANGVNTLTAYDTSSFEAVSSVQTVYLPYLLYSYGNTILCIEKNNDKYYFETFELSDFVLTEPTLINLNEESVYAGRTKNDLAKRYSEAIGGMNLSQPALSDYGSLNSPFAGTLIDSDVQASLIDFSNYLRYLGGLSGYEYGGDDVAQTVGKGSVLLRTVWSRYNITGHTPPQPTDMDDDFYNEAYSVCGGNISYGYGGTAYDQIKAIRSLNDDVQNASNHEIDSQGYHQGFNIPGHRNCFLQRGGNKLTYGYADRVLLQYYEYAQSNPNATGTITETGNNEAAYAWPSPGDFPVEEIDKDAVWTIYFNTDKLDISKHIPVVTITDLTTGERFVRNTEMHDVDGQREGYSTSNFWGKCLCFTPPKTNSYVGKSYKVTVENLIDEDKMPATVEYTVNFFNYEGEYTIDGMNYSMDPYGNLTPLSPPTEPTTAEPTTVEPTTVEPTTVELTTIEPTTIEPPTAEPTTLEPTTAEPTTLEPTTAEPTTAEPTTLEPTTEEPSTAERFLNIHSVSNTFDSQDYSVKITGNNDRISVSYYWNKDITVDSYKWNITYDAEKLSCFAYMTDRGSVNDFTEGNITSTWSNANNPIMFVEGEEFARFSFDVLSDGDTTVTFNIEEIIEHQEVVPTTTEEPTTLEPTTQAPTTAEPTTQVPTTAEPTTVAPTTAELTTAEPTTVEPSTAEPSTAEPTTAEPTMISPTTAEPTTEEPTVAPTTNPYAQYIIGDVNGDGYVDVLDATLVQKYSSEKTKLNDRQLYVADVNNDGIVDVLDAATIQKYAVEKISEFKKK